MRAANTAKAAGLGASLIFIIAARSVITPSAANDSPTASHCLFQRSGDSFSGSCGTLFDESPVFAVASSAAVKSGIWRRDLHPNAVWVGTMTEDSRDFPVELEIYEGQRGILRTEHGWFAVSHFSESSGLAFELDASREIRPGVLDQKIVERAATLLSSPATWNRADNRLCPDTASKWSIYCAMWHATIDVTGGANHRRPALEVVREVVEARSAGRNYKHRLMDYNNDPTTRLDDVRSLFREAIAVMDDPAWLAKHGFATSPAF
jgi:hypothetical protein